MSNIFEGMDLDFSKYDEVIATVQQNTERVEVPDGQYEVKLTKLESKKTKTGKPMISVWMKIIAGSYKGQLLFYNQTINMDGGTPNKFQTNLIKDFLTSLNSGIEFNAKDLLINTDTVLEEVFNVVSETKEYGVSVKTEKGFKNYKITNIFNVEG